MYRFIVIAAAAVLTLTSCNSFTKQKAGTFGEPFDTTNAVTVTQLIDQSQQGPVKTVVKGTIKSSCKSEGCWLKLDAGNGEELFVSTEDKFFIPKENMTGKTVYVSGETWIDTTSVDEQRDHARNSGKTERDISNITEPKIEVTVHATGVKVL